LGSAACSSRWPLRPPPHLAPVDRVDLIGVRVVDTAGGHHRIGVSAGTSQPAVLVFLDTAMILTMTVVSVLIGTQLYRSGFATPASVVAGVLFVQLITVVIPLFPAIRGADDVPSIQRENPGCPRWLGDARSRPSSGTGD